MMTDNMESRFLQIAFKGWNLDNKMDLRQNLCVCVWGGGVCVAGVCGGVGVCWMYGVYLCVCVLRFQSSFKKFMTV